MYHVTLGGRGLIIDLRSYQKRVARIFADKLATGDRTYDDLTHDQYWVQSDWSGGEGQRRWTAGGPSGMTGGADLPGAQGLAPLRYRSGFGVDVYSERGALRLGGTLAESFVSTVPGVRAMAVYRGRLYAGAEGSGKVFSFDGTTWSEAYDTGKSGTLCLTVHGGKLYVGNAQDGEVVAYDGTVWSTAFTVAGAGGVGAMVSYDVYDSGAGVTATHLYVGASFPGGQARVYRWDGTTLSAALYSMAEPTVEAALALRGRLYMFTSEDARGGIYAYDGTAWELARVLAGDYVAGAAVHEETAYLGAGRGGLVWTWDGSVSGRLVVVRDFGRPWQPYSDEVRGLLSFQGALWVAWRDAARGVGLQRFDGRGWSVPGVGAPGTAGLGLVAYGGKVYLGTRGQETGARVCCYEPSIFRSSGEMETSLFDARLPSVDKVWRSITVDHAKLEPGQRVTVSYSLEDSDTFQVQEDFSTTVGRDAARTTARWDTATGRLELGVGPSPPRTFAGKVRGNPSVPHVAYEGRRGLAEPPVVLATTLVEMDQVDYDALVDVDGTAAITP